MSERLFIWNAQRYYQHHTLRAPWTVSTERTSDPMNYMRLFATLPEAHDFAKGYIAAERAA